MEQVVCEIRADGSGLYCCSEFQSQVEDPDEPDLSKRFYLEGCRVYDTQNGSARIVECPYCLAEIRTYQKEGGTNGK